MNSVVLFRSVVSLVDRFPVLAGVDLDISAGEIVLLRGPNGAGKTSLLRAIAGLLSVNQGTATVLGHDVVRDPRAVRSQVGFLGHQATLYSELSVKENVEFVVRSRGLDRSNVDPVIARLGLSGRLADVAVERLSAGQRRRTALATVLASDPSLWLLDEPHSGLDVDARWLLDELMSEAVARGKTVIFSSHESTVEDSISDRFGGSVRTLTIDGGVITTKEEQEREVVDVS